MTVTETEIYRCPVPDTMGAGYGVQTLYDNFEQGLAKSKHMPFLGHRPKVSESPLVFGDYVWSSYEQVAEWRTLIGSLLLDLRRTYFPTQAQDEGQGQWAVGIYAINRPEWVIVEQACSAYSLVTVALYDTLGVQALEYITGHAEIPMIACSLDKVANILRVAKACPQLKVILCMDTLLPESQPGHALLYAWAKDRGILLMDWSQALSHGQRCRQPHRVPKPYSIATICYTSGTTGDPKGVVLTHANCVAVVPGLSEVGIYFDHDDTHISYLPLAHCFERLVQVTVISMGSKIGFYSGDVLSLLDDIQVLKPTLFASVPRLYNRIYERVSQETTQASGLRGVLFRYALQAKVARLQAGLGLKHAFWDRVLFSRVAAKLGGRLKYLVTGSAPLSPHIIQFMRLAFSCEFVEGYGATETSACGALCLPGDYSLGHTGFPTFRGEIKLKSVPEMNYLVTDKPMARGEIWIRGPFVFQGYHKSPQLTAEVLDSDGFFHTGDVGMISTEGRLSVVDRKKHIFKLANGEYVAPEKLEALYVQHPALAQIYIHGDSMEAYIVAVVVPEPAYYETWQQTAGAGAGLEAFGRHILSLLEGVAQAEGLQRFEIVRGVYLEMDAPFSVENELLTPTMKLKRTAVYQKYAQRLKALYDTIGREKSGKGDGGKRARL